MARPTALVLPPSPGGMDMNGELEQPLLQDTTAESVLDGHRREEIWVESLDYDPIHSLVFSQQKKIQQQRHLYGFTGVTLAKWLITITIGFLVGTVAYVIASHQELVTTAKKRGIMMALNNGYGLWTAFAGYCLFGITVVTFASCLVIFWTPAAAGGGVTLVMAYLNGNDVPDFFRLNTLFAKVIGTLCTVSSGLPIGQEGPMVHIGGAIASSLTWMQGYVPRRRKNGTHQQSGSFFGKLKPKFFVFDFHNDYDRREFISAGAAAGLAAAFGSPIGGVLFALEEASSFWSKKVMWRSLLCTSVATLVLSWLHEKEFSFALPGTMSFHNLQPEFVLGDLPLFVITSAAAGALGSLVNALHAWLARIRPPSDKKLARLAEAILVTFVIIVMMFVLAHLGGTCHFVPEGTDEEEFWFQYTCPNPVDGRAYYNDLASLYLAVPRQSIQKLFRLGKDAVPAFAKMTLGIHCVSWIIIFSLAYGIATPGGIFLPCMVVGSSCGALLGMFFKILFPNVDVQPGLHALIGATAMLGSMFRTSISVIVIVVEGTGGVDFILPLILAVVISNWVAHHLHHESAYEIDLGNIGSITFLHNEPTHAMIPITAADIMSENVECFPEIVTVKTVVEVLKRTRHNGFPVLRYSTSSPQADGPRTQGTFVGLVLRHQLLLLLEQRAWITVESPDDTIPIIPGPENCIITNDIWKIEHAMRVYHHCHNPHRRYLTSRAEELEMLDITEPETTSLESTQVQVQNGESVPQENGQRSPEATNARKEERALDLRPFMNRAPLTVRAECSAQRVFVIFRTLGLRHLCVTDAYNRVIGMITRKDIANAQKRTHFAQAQDDLESKGANAESMYHLP
ncbi:hypothetical protein MPTK1_2g12940 [Marchantia polymorpha subsp. ruderalis]|uniref:Chloride channel protein n=1 Tax=Marchantia polymorpha TaxID=3197 RepID=A0A2R6XAR7_MARPO|nr:hypothetical protein MARPO_0026s0078 [Marchantia polymorpha]BBN02117.1 hypothetical protein Mp_2g12940 [Marchantia polymorpha subsp. ruderalis]|eukprot:PTQ43203.1 hypothetical protein MARPO_0026s0078 [Marchantia polymorpha]